MSQNQEWQVVKFAKGMPTEDLFKCVDVDAPSESDLKDGEVLIELKALSVDPYMRGKLSGVDSYTPAYKLGAPMQGSAAGVVLKSKAEGFPEGSSCAGHLPFRKRQIASASALRQTPVSDAVPLTHHLGIIGGTGLTAYLSLKNIAEPISEGEHAFVSGGAGGVGSAVIQLLAAKGVKVIASAGTDEKVQRCKDMGAAAAFNYKTVGEGQELEQTLNAFAPKGLNLYYDNVGGRTLEAAIACMAGHGRIVSCGAISQYNTASPSEAYGVKNLSSITRKSLKMQGFIVTNWLEQWADARKTLYDLVSSGKLKSLDTIVDGFDKMPEAFVALFKGGNVGKMVVRC
ncbi:putative NADP-dependent oxidoreductase YfmJ [Diplonema papillatum]|nr:putative NADP-dependent oxidoreductase YfmJ [Diplonema papillatum]